MAERELTRLQQRPTQTIQTGGGDGAGLLWVGVAAIGLAAFLAALMR